MGDTAFAKTKAPERSITKLLGLCVAAVLVLLLWATLAQQPQSGGALAAPNGDRQPALKIGFVVSLTGVGADPSHDMVNGIKLFLKEHDNMMAGRPVQLIIENDESSPVTAMAKVEKLIRQDKVDVLDGFHLSSNGLAAARVAERAQVPLVLAVCGADDLTQRRHSDWLVRTSASASQPCHPFGQYAYEKLGFRRIVVISMNYPFGWEVADGFQRGFEAAGGQVVQKIWAPLGFTDFKTFLSRIDRTADAVFICATSAAAEILPRQYKEMGIKLPVVASGTTFDESILPHIPNSFVGSYSTMTYCPTLNTPSNKRFVAAYQREYAGKQPSFYAEGAYVSGMWIDKALQAVHGDVSDKQKFLAALKQVELADAPRGPIKLDDYANPIENVYIRQVQRLGGKLQNTVVANFKNVSQFWIWPAPEYLKQPVYNSQFPCPHCTSTK